MDEDSNHNHRIIDTNPKIHPNPLTRGKNMRTENQWLFFGKEESQILVNTVGIENTTDSLREFMENSERSNYRALATVKKAVFDAIRHPDDDDEFLASINQLVEGFMKYHTDEDGESISDATSSMEVRHFDDYDDEIYTLFYFDEAVFDIAEDGYTWFITNSDGKVIYFDDDEWVYDPDLESKRASHSLARLNEGDFVPMTEWK